MNNILNKIGSFFCYKWTKRLLGLFILFGISGAFLQDTVLVDVPVVYAEEDKAATSTTQEKTTTEGTIDHTTLKNRAITLNNLLKVIYIILWPLIALAGISLDNTLVYGSVFHLDVPLWKLWNIIKNFANFALGFLVLFEILKSIFTGFNTEGAVGGPMKVIKNALIAGVLIQASWFLTAAVIDISTIATYAIGGLPMSILETAKGGEEKLIADTPIMGVHTNIQYKDMLTSEDGFDVRYTYGNSNRISQCKYAKNGNITYVVGKTNGTYLGETNSGSYEKGLCVHHNHSLVKFIDLEEKIYQTANNNINNTDYQTELKHTLDEAWDNSDIRDEYVSAGNFVNTKDRGKGYEGEEKIGTNGGDAWLTNQNGTTISKLIGKSKGFSHALITLYNSLLGFAHMSDFDVATKGAGGARLEMLIKTIFAAALVIPLLILTIVLLARIAYLWLVIAFAPLLILFRLFFKDSKGMGDMGDSIPSIGDLMGIIFAPVVTVFVLSLSVIFMSVLVNTINDDRDKFFSTLEIERTTDGENETLNINGQLGMGGKGSNDSGFGNAADLISWMIVNLFAIGLIWTLLFSAIKSNKVGKAIVGKIPGIENWLGQALQSIPIIPLGDGSGKGVGIGSAMNVLGKAPSRFMSKIQGDQSAAFTKAYIDKSDNISESNHANIASHIGSGMTLDQAIKKEGLNSTTSSEYLKMTRSMKGGFDGGRTSDIKEIKLSEAKSHSTNHIKYLLNTGKVKDAHGGDDIETKDGIYHMTTHKDTSGKKRYTLTERTKDEKEEDFEKKKEATLKGVEKEHRDNLGKHNPKRDDKKINNAKFEYDNTGKESTNFVTKK